MKTIIILFFLCQSVSSEYSSGWVISNDVVAEASLHKSQIKIKVSEGRAILFVKSIKAKIKLSSIYYFGMCELGGKIQQDIIAYGSYKHDRQYSYFIHNAWRINIQKKKLDIISTSGLRCINESYPGDGS
jgi:hypothetical protein